MKLKEEENLFMLYPVNGQIKSGECSKDHANGIDDLKKKNPHTMLDVVIRYSKEVLCLENQTCKSLICARFGAMFNSYFYFSSVFIFFYFPGQQKRQTRASWNSSGREEKWKEFLLCYWLYRSELKKQAG